VNPDLARPKDVEIALHGGKVKSASGVALAANDIHAHNTFDQPDTVRTAKLDLSTRGDFVTATFPPASVVKVEVILQ
jgi:alpha-N-arabinofuranosidase